MREYHNSPSDCLRGEPSLGGDGTTGAMFYTWSLLAFLVAGLTVCYRASVKNAAVAAGPVGVTEIASSQWGLGAVVQSEVVQTELAPMVAAPQSAWIGQPSQAQSGFTVQLPQFEASFKEMIQEARLQHAFESLLRAGYSSVDDIVHADDADLSQVRNCRPCCWKLATATAWLTPQWPPFCFFLSSRSCSRSRSWRGCAGR